MKNVLTPSAKKVLLQLGLAVGMAATDTSIQKKTSGSEMKALIISNEEMEYIMKIAKSLEKRRFTNKKN